MVCSWQLSLFGCLSRVMRKDDDDGMPPYICRSHAIPGRRLVLQVGVASHDKYPRPRRAVAYKYPAFDVISIWKSRCRIATQRFERPQREPRGTSKVLCVFLSFLSHRQLPFTHTHPHTACRILVSTEPACFAYLGRGEAIQSPTTNSCPEELRRLRSSHSSRSTTDTSPDTRNLLDDRPAARPFSILALNLFYLRSFAVEPLFNYIVMDETLAVGQSRHYPGFGTSWEFTGLTGFYKHLNDPHVP